MNISGIRTHITLGLAGFIAMGSALLIPQTGFAEIIYCQDSSIEGCVEKKGRGGSNPLVIEELRQQTYRTRENESIISTLEAGRNDKLEIITDQKPTPYPTVIPYPENFKTIGEVQAELAALESEIEASSISDEIINLYNETQKQKFSSQFSDIEGNKNQRSIEILDAMNIVSGRENGEFLPNEAITRKEAIKISELIAGKEITISKISSIRDIDNNDWSVPYMETAIINKMIYTEKGSAFEGDSSVFAEEAFALYLNATQVSVSFSNKEFEETYNMYKEYAEAEESKYTIINYTPNFENETITRGEFAELSLYILNALRKEEDYEPTQQLNGTKYSASQAEIQNPYTIFPELFTK